MFNVIHTLALAAALILASSLCVYASNDYLSGATPEMDMIPNASNIVTVDYVGNYVYEEGTLTKILFDGGYVDMTGSDRLFGGKELDSSSGLHDFEARYDNTILGRFTTMDPMAEKYYGVSPYSYCAGNPVNWMDPDGRVVRVKVGNTIIGRTSIYYYSSTERKNNPNIEGAVSTIVPVYQVDISNDSGDTFAGIIKSRWKTIQFHTKGATDGCLMCVGKNQFITVEKGYELRDDLPATSSSAQMDFIKDIINFQREDLSDNYKDDIYVIFEKLYW